MISDAQQLATQLRRTITNFMCTRFYLGQCPFLSVTDLELIRLITIKDFDYFVNRPVSLAHYDSKAVLKIMLSANGSIWGYTRPPCSQG